MPLTGYWISVTPGWREGDRSETGCRESVTEVIARIKSNADHSGRQVDAWERWTCPARLNRAIFTGAGRHGPTCLGNDIVLNIFVHPKSDGIPEVGEEQKPLRDRDRE